VEFTGSRAQFSGQLDESLFGRAEYQWEPPSRDFNAHLPESLSAPSQIYHGGHADPDGPIVRKKISGGDDFELPAASVVVLRGRL
jgi:hypothetical protein